MKKVQLLFFVAVAILCIWFAYSNHIAASVVTIACTIVIIAIARLDDIEEISVLNLIKTKLNKKLKEAEVTIEQTKSLGKALSKATLRLVALDMLSRVAPPRSSPHLCQCALLEIKEEIDSCLRQLGLSKEEIKEVSSPWYSAVDSVYRRIILRGLPASELIKNEAEQFFSGRAINSKEVYPGDLKSFLNKYGLLNTNRLELINDYEYFLKTGEVRNPHDLLVF